MRKKKYKLYDTYEAYNGGEKELLGTYESMDSVRRVCKRRDADIDGEWAPLLKELKDDNKYAVKEDWSY